MCQRHKKFVHLRHQFPQSCLSSRLYSCSDQVDYCIGRLCSFLKPDVRANKPVCKPQAKAPAYEEIMPFGHDLLHLRNEHHVIRKSRPDCAICWTESAPHTRLKTSELRQKAECIQNKLLQLSQQLQPQLMSSQLGSYCSQMNAASKALQPRYPQTLPPSLSWNLPSAQERHDEEPLTSVKVPAAQISQPGRPGLAAARPIEQS